MGRSSLGRLSLVAIPILVIAALVILAWRTREAPTDRPLRVGAAISLQEALQAIAAEFQDQTGQRVALSFGSSGQIATQIANGAPIDLFISADHEKMDGLVAAGAVDPATRRIVACNALVLIVPADSAHPPTQFEDLAGPNIERLAMGEPRSVPAGRYAQQVLDHLGLAGAVRDRTIWGTNVRQVLSYVERGEVSAGIVYRTDALEAGGRVRQVAVADEAWHDRIEYSAAIVTGTSVRQPAEAFLEFLASSPARQRLAESGFALPDSLPRTD